MTKEKINEIIDLAIETYGVNQQLNQVNEELAELIVEVAKNKRGFKNRKKIIEEMGDVLHCFEYLKRILDIKDSEVQDAMEYKIERTYRRIRDGYDVSKLEV